MSGDDTLYQFWKPLVQFYTARDVAHLDAMALTSNQAGLAKNPEMLGKGGLRDMPIANREVTGARLRTSLGDGADENGHPYGSERA